jgi:hypothetical protein
LLLVVSALVVAGCISGSKANGGAGGSGGGTGGSPAAGGAGGIAVGGAAGGAGGGSGGALANPNPTGLCPGGTATCTDAEWNTYTTCVANACDAQYRLCLGVSYRTGVYAGPCGPWAHCLSACGCGNAGCRAACPAQTAECASCFSSASSCLVDCNIPMCAVATAPDAGTHPDAAGARDAATGANCAGLAACCNAIADPTQQSDCQDTYDAVAASGDRACGQILDEFEAIGYCR